MKESYFIGLDLAKNVFQVFTADSKAREVSNKKLGRNAMTRHFAQLPTSVIGIEACGTAHHWARTLTGLGHTVKLINPQRVKAFLGSRNKTDGADAKAICEALMHPGTTFIRAKSLEEQDIDHLLARREMLVQNRTQLVNQTRAFLCERGVAIPQGRGEDGQPRGLSFLDRWILGMVERIGLFKAAIALANKLCRIAWALLARGEEFNPVALCRVEKST